MEILGIIEHFDPLKSSFNIYILINHFQHLPFNYYELDAVLSPEFTAMNAFLEFTPINTQVATVNKSGREKLAFGDETYTWEIMAGKSCSTSSEHLHFNV